MRRWLRILIMLAIFAAGQQCGRYERRPVDVPAALLGGPKPSAYADKPGELDTNAPACEMSWALCWITT